LKFPKEQLALLGFLISSFVFPQNYTITGIIVASEAKPLEFATVSVFNEIDNQLVTGSTSDDKGRFVVGPMEKGKYYLIASYLQSKTEQIAISLASDIDVGTLILPLENQLDEVAVIAERPKLERRADRYVFTIEKTSLVDGNISDLLSRTPGLLVINDQLNYKGESGIGVMINDKLINLPPENVWEFLKNASAGAVQAVEVITNPPARYSAEGNVLINIKMKGILVAGYNGSVNGTFGQGDFPKYGLGTEHFFKTKKSALTVGYGWSDRKEASGFLDVTNFNENGVASKWSADQNRIRNNLAQTLSVFYDYTIDKNTTLSINSINQLTPREDQDILTDTQITGNNTDNFQSFLSNNQVTKNVLNSSTYLEFDKKFSEGKQRFSTMAHFTYFDNERNQVVNNAFFDTAQELVDEIDFNTLSTQQIRIITAQADYESEVGKKTTLSVGTKFAGIDSNSSLLQEGVQNLNNGILAADGSFDYDEQIYAAYTDFDFAWTSTNLSLGLRMEYTETKGEQTATGEVFRNNYLEWFPNLSFKHELTDDKSILAYYYRRITRPRYDQINPFQLFQGFNSTVEGNPRLQPAIRHYLAAGYNFNKWIGFELFYRYRRNQLRRLTFQDNTGNLVRFVSSNVDRELGYGIDLMVNKKITSFWQSYLLWTYYYLDNRFQDLESGQFGTTSGWTLELTNNNSFTLLPSKDLFIDLDIRYRSPYAFGNTTARSYGSVNLSAQKRFCDGRASLSMGVTDIFSQRAFLEERRFNNQNNTSFIDPETPIFNTTFRYRFGNTQMKNNKKRKRQGEVQRL
jgi:hypothetical protein